MKFALYTQSRPLYVLCWVLFLASYSGWNTAHSKPHQTQGSFFDSLNDISQSDQALETSFVPLEPLPVTEAFKPLTQYFAPSHETPGTFSISWTIEDGYYLYKDRFKASVSPNTEVQLGDLVFSKPGILKSDPGFGDVMVYKKSVEITIPVQVMEPQLVELTLDYMGCMEDVLCYPPKKLKESFHIEPGGTFRKSLKTDKALREDVSKDTTPDTKANTNIRTLDTEQNEIKSTNSLNTDTDVLLSDGSLIVIAITFFGLGLLMAFTACVYPMIPILSSIIVGQGSSVTKSRAFALSFTYVQAVAITYGIGGIAGAQLGENITNLLQTPGVLITSAILFVILAASMFGFYDIRLPSRLQNRLDALSRKQKSGKFLGAFMMGVFSGLVVSPCVAPPLLAALAYAASSGELVRGGIALYSLGLGMSSPLLFIGLAGGNLLPKAGVWMDGVKSFFGVLLLGVAISMLERLLAPSLTLFLWGVWLIIPAIYLGALDKSTAGASWFKFRKGFGIVMLIYGTCLIIGALKGNENPLRPLVSNANSFSQAYNSQKPDWTYVTNVNELEIMVKSSDQPSLLDFYADWCIECKIMEREVFSSPQIQAQLNQFQMIKVDVTAMTEADTELMQMFNLFGPPAILFFNTDGEEMPENRVIGGQSLTDFSNTLSEIIRLNNT